MERISIPTRLWIVKGQHIGGQTRKIPWFLLMPNDNGDSILTVRFLGTGGSFGIPVLLCRCRTCQSVDTRDQRTRSSVLLEWEGCRILIDCGPDLRTQLIREGGASIEEVWLTHSHSDHTAGMDDLRPYCFGGRTLTVRGDIRTLAEVQDRFAYAFKMERDPSGVSHPTLLPLPVQGAFEVHGMKIVPLPVWHGPFSVLGYRIGDFAYITDISIIPEETWPLLEGLECIVLSALRPTEHPTHQNFEQAMAVARKIGAKSTWFTHFAHDLPHKDMLELMAPFGAPAWDGLTLQFSMKRNSIV